MGSGRGDRNQGAGGGVNASNVASLQWGPVVVTGISPDVQAFTASGTWTLQWGPVVVTGISRSGPTTDDNRLPLQWGPVVVTGIRARG